MKGVVCFLFYQYSMNFTLKTLRIQDLQAEVVSTIKKLHSFSYRSYVNFWRKKTNYVLV